MKCVAGTQTGKVWLTGKWVHSLTMALGPMVQPMVLPPSHTLHLVCSAKPLVHSNIFIPQVLEQQKGRNCTVTIHTLSTPALLVCVCAWTGSYFCFWTNSHVSRPKTNLSDRGEWPWPSSLQRMFIYLLFLISVLPANVCMCPTYMSGTSGDLKSPWNWSYRW